MSKEDIGLEEVAKELGMARVLSVKALSNPVLLNRLKDITAALGQIPDWSSAADNGVCNGGACGSVAEDLMDPAKREAIVSAAKDLLARKRTSS